jgi:hypothetical protein
MARFADTVPETFPAESVLALGAALQAVGEDAVGINLLPPEKRARREKNFSPLTLALIGVILILAIVWPISVVVQQHRVLNVIAKRKMALDPSVQQVQTQDSEASRLIERLKVVDESTQSVWCRCSRISPK